MRPGDTTAMLVTVGILVLAGTATVSGTLRIVTLGVGGLLVAAGGYKLLQVSGVI